MPPLAGRAIQSSLRTARYTENIYLRTVPTALSLYSIHI
jgi:hypothetical protein